MSYNPVKLNELRELIDRHTETDMIRELRPIPGFHLFKTDKIQPQSAPVLYRPGIFIGVQGEKVMNLNGRPYDYNPGHFLTLFIPMTIECMVVKASPEEPIMGAFLSFDQGILARIMMKLDRTGYSPALPDEDSVISGIYTSELNDRLLNGFIRLTEALDDPVEAAVLGESIIDEIYFHILYSEQGGIFHSLLHQNGQIQQISRAVDYVHSHLDRSVSVDELAGTVNMGSSNFHRKFKEVMHLSPLQYMKKIKLSTAQALISEGSSVSEAGYRVGYKSPSQFSREYKRFFGSAPSGDQPRD